MKMEQNINKTTDESGEAKHGVQSDLSEQNALQDLLKAEIKKMAKELGCDPSDFFLSIDYDDSVVSGDFAAMFPEGE